MISGLVYGVARHVGDFLFPPACPGCGRMLGEHGGVCQECWGHLAFIERPYCEVLGVPFAHDLGKGIVSAEAIANPPDFDRLRSVCVFDGTARKLVHALKYNDRTELAPMMAGWMARAGAELLGECDELLPVPLHLFRLMSRKYNQAGLLAKALSHHTGKPVLASTVRRTRNTRHQIGLGRNSRAENVRGAFRAGPFETLEIAGRRLVIVDDVYTTVATVSAVARVLKRSGAARVDVLTFARALPDTI